MSMFLNFLIEIKEIIPLTITSERIRKKKPLGINLAKEITDLNFENYKTDERN